MKRFTETDKWRDTWFRKLPLEHKAAFDYLCENCDCAGVWEPDFELANFCLGAEIDWNALFKAMGARVLLLPDGKWYLTRFVEFQYGALSENCKPHQKVIAVLRSHGIPIRVVEGYAIPFPKGIQRDKEEEKDKEEDKDREGDAPDAGAANGELFDPADASLPKPPPKSPLQRRAEMLFNRRESTVWDASERRSWDRSSAAIRATSEDDWQLLEWYYSLPADQTFRRRDLATLLNNWGAEIDRARSYRSSRPSATKQPDIYVEPPNWRERARAKWPNVTLPERWGDLSSTLRLDLINGR